MAQWKMLIKIFKSTFSGGDFRLRCFNDQNKKEFCCRKMFLKKLSCVVVQAAFWQWFSHVANRQLQQNIKKYRWHERSLYRNKENSGRLKIVYCEKNIEQVRNMLEINARNISARRNGMGLSAATFNRITCVVVPIQDKS